MNRGVCDCCLPVRRLGSKGLIQLLFFDSKLFDITDTDKDGKVTFDEWRNSAVRSTFSGETDSMLAKQWAKFDTANVGYLTKDEATNRRA